MKKNTKQKWAIIILSILVVVLLFVTIYQNFFLNLNDKPPLEQPTKDIVMTVEDYTVFDLEDIPFKFVVATLEITSNEAINIPLSNFKTNENIVLNSVDEYRKSLESKGYDLSLMGVTFSDLVSLENTLQSSLFIPVKSLSVSKVQLLLSESFQDQLSVKIEPITLDLSNPTGKKEMLGRAVVDEPDPDQEPIDAQTVFSSGPLTEVDSSHIFIEDDSSNLQPVDYPAFVRIYATNVTVSSDKRVGIAEARLTFTNTNEVFYAIDENYVYQNGSNIIGKSDFYFDGYLLFEISSSNPYLLTDQEPYTIEYKLIDQDEWQSFDE